MEIFEVEVPGSILVSENPQTAFKLYSQLLRLIEIYTEANVALNHFKNSAHVSVAANRLSSQNWEADRARLSEIRMEIEAENGDSPSVEPLESWMTAKRRLLHEKAASGHAPLAHNRISWILHARSFVFALDSFERQLKVLSMDDGAPSSLVKIHESVGQIFPDLRG